jgi:hypothetical protein
MSSAFQDPAAPPAPGALTATLGAALPAWERIVAHTLAAIPRATLAWKHYKGGYGWQARLGAKTRAALWLVPHEGSFLCATAVKDAALPALAASDLPAAWVQEIAAGRRLPEGRAARVEVHGEAEAALVIRLLELCA